MDNSPRRGGIDPIWWAPVLVLVVIAIVAITLFRPKIQELWDAIANGINGL